MGMRPFNLWATDENGKEIFRKFIAQRAKVSVPVAMIPRTFRHITLHVDSPNLPLPGDTRILNVALTRLDWSNEPLTTLPEDDVFPIAQGLGAGMGWHAPEPTPDGYVRWMDNDAEIWFHAGAEGGKQLIDLDVEGGQGLDYRPFRLWATDQRGRGIFSAIITRRKVVSIPIEMASNAVGHITLHVQSENRRSSDGRILNVLLRKADLRQHRPGANGEPILDVSAEEIRFGTGWYDVEQTSDGPARWITNNAEIYVDGSAEAQTVMLDLELGPSAGIAPRKLTFRDESGGLVEETTLTGRQIVRCRLPTIKRGLATVIVEVESESRELEGRMLNILARRVELTPGSDAKAQPPAEPTIIMEESKPAPARSNLATASRNVPPRRRLAPPPPPVGELMAPAAHARIVSPVFLHNNACGDFTLMHRDHWFEVRGHAEWDAFSIHLDSLICFCAHHSGAVETVLTEPMRLYHIEHSIGSGWTPEGMDKLLRRIRALGIPDVDWKEVGRIGVLLRRYDSPVSFSPSDWGLERESLPETRVNPKLS